MSLRSLFFLVLMPMAVLGQKVQNAAMWGQQGVVALDRGAYKEAIKLLTKAWNAHPSELEYPFELGRAYLLNSNATKAEKVLHPLQYHKAAGPEVYLLLATAYDSLGRDRAQVNTYRYGIERYPSAGVLYNRLAAHYVSRDSITTALAICEAGLKHAPKFADNYFLASRIMDAKGDALWAWWYGEVFLNLTDDVHAKRGMAERVAENTRKVFNGTWVPEYYPIDQAVKQVSDHCADESFENEIAHQTALRECFISQFNGRDAYSQLLRDMQAQGTLELYAAYQFGEVNKENFLQWLSGNAAEYERFRQWFYWNGLKLTEPFTRHTIIAP